MNKKGFTLIELLAVIVILALLALIAYPNVARIISDSKNKTSSVQFSALESAAKKYVSAHSDTLGDVETVCIPDLKEEGLLENKKIVDPKTNEEYNGCFKILWSYAYNQYTYTYFEDLNKFVTKITGDGTNVGDELAIGKEHFYVVSNDGTKVVLLAKYNLLVGSICTGSSSSTCTPIESPTGIQDATAIGEYRSEPSVGTVPYSSTAYWGSVSEGTYVYDNRASLSQYVNDYQTYLENLGATIIESRLIKKSELVTLGCPSGGGSCTNGSGAPAWVYSTSYWTGSARAYGSMWYVGTRDSMDTAGNTYETGMGVRPVIVISASAL